MLSLACALRSPSRGGHSACRPDGRQGTAFRAFADYPLVSGQFQIRDMFGAQTRYLPGSNPGLSGRTPLRTMLSGRYRREAESMAKEIFCSIGVDIDAVAGWLGSYGGEDSPDDISRG